MFEKKLGQRGIYSGLMSGSGYVYIPNDIQDRKKFISNCYNTCTISFVTIEGQRFDNVPVSTTIFDQLDFPQNVKEVGSLLFWVKHQVQNKPIVVAILTRKGEVLNIQQDQFFVGKKTSKGYVTILGDASKGNLFLKGEGSGSILSILFKNVKLKLKQIFLIESNDISLKVLSTFNLIIKNDLSSDAENILYFDKDKMSYEDSFGNIILIDKDKFSYQNDKAVFTIEKSGKFTLENDKGSFVIDGDTIIGNGGDNGGLAIVSELVKRLNNIENDVNNLKTAFTTWVPTPMDGGLALKVASAAWFGSVLSPTVDVEIEDKKFKH
jgi:hypothetical protein